MYEWYFSSGEDQKGPYDHNAAIAYAKDHPDSYCWREGFSDWLPVGEVSDLHGADAVPIPPEAFGRMTRGGRPGSADEVDYHIYGQEMQYVEIELDPGESVVAEAGSMMYKDDCVEMNTIFGDGSEAESPGIVSSLLGAGTRLITGESLFFTVFTHQGQGKARVAFAAPYPGSILAIDLKDVGGRLICQKDSFLCAAKGVSIGIHFQRRVLTGLFGGEGFIMQSLSGDGLVFVHMGGALREKELAPGERLHVDTGCLAAMSPSVDMDVTRVGGIKTMLFGGEGIFFADLCGPGHVWMQSLPFSRLASRMLAAAPSRGGSRGEGSLLGGLGNLLDGDGR